MVTNCTGERSFSRLKWIKNDRRTTMTQARLDNLALMNIENELLISTGSYKSLPLRKLAECD
jgi:hypothetical protein